MQTSDTKLLFIKSKTCTTHDTETRKKHIGTSTEGTPEFFSIHHPLLARLPFVHLLPHAAYQGVLRLSGEPQGTINELMNIRKTRITIEQFEKLSCQHFRIADRQLWFINPHYESKFRLPPRKLWKLLGHLPILRDFFSTSCWYLLK